MELMQQMEERFAKISEQARRDGVEAELLVEAGESLKLSVSAGKVEKFDASQSQVGGLRVILDGVEGYSSTLSRHMRKRYRMRSLRPAVAQPLHWNVSRSIRGLK